MEFRSTTSMHKPFLRKSVSSIEVIYVATVTVERLALAFASCIMRVRTFQESFMTLVQPLGSQRGVRLWSRNQLL